MALHHGKLQPTFRAGKAGLIASFVIAFAGAALGALAAYLGEFGAGAAASVEAPHISVALAQQKLEESFERERIIQKVINRTPLERFTAPTSIAVVQPSARPKIAIILDDIGLDPQAAVDAFALPGPVTYSILPYAQDIEWIALQAARREGDIMLHLPMQPKRKSDDPGPNALRGDMSGTEFLRALEWNLTRFDGYVGVNNHMGSKLTANSAAMRTVLAYLAERDLFFIDSKTTNASVAQQIGAQLGADVIARDIFLDPTPGDADEVRRQLRLVEEIALKTGYVVAIGHPRPETLSVLAPWLASAEARGFELTTPSAIISPPKPTLLVAAPDIRG